MKLVRVLTIAGSDSCGGAGIQADLKTIMALGGFGMSVVTALTAQNTLGIQDVYEISPEFVEKQFESIMADVGIDAAKTGMLTNTSILKTVARMIRKYCLEKVVVDPVMAAKGGEVLIRGKAKEAFMSELLPLAFVVTPNIPEAEVLSEMKIASVSDMKKAAKVIHRFGAKNVIIKGGHLTGDAVDILYDGRIFRQFSSERIDKKETHGTGCIFSAAIATLLAKGRSVSESAEEAKAYITQAIKASYSTGTGYRLITHFFPASSDK
ncbi:MAG TPA: bifunctional hydroxymethylpyrimidine kinase/phosphomethylpyrimidine kinase [Syntrophales bacterium]|nr:bifunctional hydroxymethylpyrimidine kinase/phosphomethylpyrimidine kinase [Syntrophales bacterium]